MQIARNGIFLIVYYTLEVLDLGRCAKLLRLARAALLNFARRGGISDRDGSELSAV